MKSYGYLYEKYISEENYYEALTNAVRHIGKKNKKSGKATWYKTHIEENLKSTISRSQKMDFAKHHVVIINDGIRRKQRKIMVPSMQEHIIHHMIVNVLKPIFMKGMYEHSYGSIPGRGAHKGKKQIERWIRNNDKYMKYCLKLDVHKYFDSIPHDILMQKFSSIIRDWKFLEIIRKLVESNGLDTGIPIGFYTSQWIANWYLNGLDHYIKEKLKVKYYIRYMDDMVIFGSNKRDLHIIKNEIEEYLKTKLGLKLKDNWQIFLFDYIDNDGSHIGRDLDFMGFRFFRNRTILRKNLMIKLTRKARRLAKKERKTIYDCRQMLSYLGWIDCTDTYKMYKKHVKPYVSFQYLKRKVGAYQRKINRETKEVPVCPGMKIKMGIA